MGGADQASDDWQSDRAIWAATPGALEWLRRVQHTVQAADKDEPPAAGR